MMDATLKARWIEALRSGDYKQGQHRLCTIDAEGNKYHCCLGVLLDIIDPTCWGPELSVLSDELESGELKKMSKTRWARPGKLASYTSLPDYIQEEVGIPSATEALLMGMNDARDSPGFPGIADYIEANV